MLLLLTRGVLRVVLTTCDSWRQVCDKKGGLLR